MQKRKRYPTSGGLGTFAKRARLDDPIDLFWHYADQVNNKQNKKKVDDPIVAKHAFPPTDLRGETNVKFNQQILAKIAGGDPAWQMILIGTFQAPDNPWCFVETLPAFLKGVKAQREGHGPTQVKKHFNEVGRILEKRYVRGIPAQDLKSGKRKGTVQGYGDTGLYSAEHQSAILPGMTHPQGLRWKLEHWPYWCEHALLPLVKDWPAASDAKGIDALLKRKNFAKLLPEGIGTKIVPRSGAKAVRIVDLFGGSAAYASSVISQALLFQEMLKPSDPDQRGIRIKYGWGVGPFTVRGLWMECNKYPPLEKNFPQIDSATFCPGFVGALGGIKACNLEETTGVSLTARKGGTVNWSKWDVQVRFAAWLYDLQSRRPDRDLHCTELEATLCFFLRYAKMRASDPKSMQYQMAARAIGANLDAKVIASIYDKRHIREARAIIA